MIRPGCCGPANARPLQCTERQHTYGTMRQRFAALQTTRQFRLDLGTIPGSCRQFGFGDLEECVTEVAIGKMCS